MEQLHAFLDFAQSSPTAFHAVRQLADQLEGAGFIRLREADPWLVDAGEKYVVTRNDSALIAFSVPSAGFLLPSRMMNRHSTAAPTVIHISAKLKMAKLMIFT